MVAAWALVVVLVALLVLFGVVDVVVGVDIGGNALRFCVLLSHAFIAALLSVFTSQAESNISGAEEYPGII